jgi:hypothetical protein
MSFFKVDADGVFHEAPNFVHAPSYSLVIADKDGYDYPVDGWTWFDTEEEAKAHFEVTNESSI